MNTQLIKTGSLSALRAANSAITASLREQVRLTREAQRNVASGGAVDWKTVNGKPVGVIDYARGKLRDARGADITEKSVKAAGKFGYRGINVLSSLASGNLYGAMDALDKLTETRVGRALARSAPGQIVASKLKTAGALMGKALAVGASWELGAGIGAHVRERYVSMGWGQGGDWSSDAAHRAQVQSSIDEASRLTLANTIGADAATARMIKQRVDERAEKRLRLQYSGAAGALTDWFGLTTVEADRAQLVQREQSRVAGVLGAVNKDTGMQGSLRAEALSSFIGQQGVTEEQIRAEIAKLVVQRLDAIEADVTATKHRLEAVEKQRAEAVDKNPSLRSLWRDQARYFSAVQKEQLTARNNWSSY